MTSTKKLLSLDPCKKVVPFGDGTNHQFSHSDLQHMGDPTGISCEEVDFLYGLVRIVRPHNCLETGTNYGCSASAICLALQENGVGHLTTIEHDSGVADIASNKLAGMGFKNFTVFKGEVSQYSTTTPLDFLWLDSELNQRFAELLRFFPLMCPGAIACIHDLWNLDWAEFGGIPTGLRDLLAMGDLRALTFNTPHGVTVFQKRREVDVIAEISAL